MRVPVFALVAAAARQLCSRRVATALCAARRPRAARDAATASRRVPSCLASLIAAAARASRRRLPPTSAVLRSVQSIGRCLIASHAVQMSVAAMGLLAKLRLVASPRDRSLRRRAAFHQYGGAIASGLLAETAAPRLMHRPCAALPPTSAPATPAAIDATPHRSAKNGEGPYPASTDVPGPSTRPIYKNILTTPCTGRPSPPATSK